jgi:hypothetical protein
VPWWVRIPRAAPCTTPCEQSGRVGFAAELPDRCPHQANLEEGWPSGKAPGLNPGDPSRAGVGSIPTPSSIVRKRGRVVDGTCFENRSAVTRHRFESCRFLHAVRPWSNGQGHAASNRDDAGSNPAGRSKQALRLPCGVRHQSAAAGTGVVGLARYPPGRICDRGVQR